MAMVPNETEIERSFLYRLIENEGDLCTYSNKVEEEHFTTVQRQFIFAIAKKYCVEFHRKITDDVIAYEIQSRVDKEHQDDFSFEWKLIKQCANKSVAQIEVLHGIIEEAKKKRITADVVRKAANDLSSGQGVDEIIGEAMTGLLGISTKKERSEVKSLADCDDVIQEINDKQEHPEKFAGIKSGFKTYDKKTGGFHPAELIVFSAISSVGKSTMLKMLAFNLAFHEKKNVLFVSDEETNSEVRIKFASMATGIPAFDIRGGNVDAQGKKRIVDALSHLPMLHTVEIAERSTAAVIAEKYYSEVQKGFKADVIIIDYLDRLAPSCKSYDQYDEQGKMIMDVKGLARSLNVTIISATQSNASAEEKQKKGSHMNKTETHGSKKVLHEVDALMFINLQGYTLNQLRTQGGDRDEESDCDRVWRIEVAKHRTAPCFDFYCQHHVRVGKVTEMTKDEFENHVGQSNDAGTIEAAIKKLPPMKTYDESESVVPKRPMGEEAKRKREEEAKAVEEFNKTLKLLKEKNVQHS